MSSDVSLHEIVSQHLPAPVPYAVLTPRDAGPLPVCLLLLGAGGTRENLIDLQPAFEEWWTTGTVIPMIVAVPSAGMDYYMEDGAGTIRWDSFLAEDFLPLLRASSGSKVVCIAGISGGGYGALKLAFAHPDLFRAVAAMQPMLEPGLRASDAGPRNRLHHLAGGPKQLIGPERDAALWEANNPANRARANAHQLHDSGLAVYLEAGDRDFLNAHDGAEFLHRLLWDLDLSHEYRLVRGADHGGPTMRPRIRAMFAWLSSVLRPAPPDPAAEQAATLWLESGMQGKPPAGVTTTEAFIRFLRSRFEGPRAEAARGDPSTNRTFGRL